MKIELTKEESAHLISLGIPREKASSRISHGFLGADPIFTFTDIFEILPKEIECNDKSYFLHIQRMKDSHRDNLWVIRYEHRSELLIEFSATIELIDCFYELCIHLLEDKYL